MESSNDGAKRQGHKKIPWKPIQEGSEGEAEDCRSDTCESKSSDQLCSAHHQSAVLLSRGHVYSHAALLPDQVVLLPINISYLPTILCSS